MSTSSDAAADAMIGRTIDGRYRVESRIAYGGMATVYLARDTRLQRSVAVKIMHAHLAENERFRAKFMSEALSSAKLSHPNVVSIFDHGSDQELSYLVMEYLPSITLRQHLRDQGRLEVREAMDIVEHILSGLSTAHRQGIVHRDLKPENILLVNDGRIKIADFGLARATSEQTSAGDELIGTIAYMSPELVSRGHADARSDIYAVGVMLYEMLVGAQPFTGEQPVQVAMQHLNAQFPLPSAAEPSVPESVDDLILWATSKDPGERPRDASEMLDQVHVVTAALGTNRPPSTGAITQVVPAPTPTRVLTPPPAGVERLTGVTTVFPPASGTETAMQEPDGGEIGAAGGKLVTKRRRSRARGWIGFLLVLLLAGGAAGVGWYFGAGPGAPFELPAVAGSTQDDAEATLTALELVPEVVTEHSLEVDEGDVIRTDPDAATKVHRGDPVTLVVSLGPRMIETPDLAGVGTTDAQQRLQDAGFTVGDVTEVYSDKQDAGRVLKVLSAKNKTVKAGTELKEGTKLGLQVSLGSVPALTGMSEDDAEAKLADLGLTAKVTKRAFDEQAQKGVVLAQSQDYPLAKDGTVKLTVSKGPEMVTVPDVSGMTIAKAKKKLEADGFQVSVPLAEALWPAAQVTSTTPSSGTEVRKSEASVTLHLELAL